MGPTDFRPQYSGQSEAAPALPAYSPMVPAGVTSRQRKKQRADFAKWKGQMRALEKLEPPPTPPRIPEKV